LLEKSVKRSKDERGSMMMKRIVENRAMKEAVEMLVTRDIKCRLAYVPEVAVVMAVVEHLNTPPPSEPVTNVVGSS
jgi:hypothetical protein